MQKKWGSDILGCFERVMIHKEKDDHLFICRDCPIYKDGYRSKEMCGHLECWEESQ